MCATVKRGEREDHGLCPWESMLDIKFIRENLAPVKESIKKRNLKIEIEPILSLDAKRTSLIQKIEALRAERNKISEERTASHVKRGREIKEELKTLEPQLQAAESQLQGLLWNLPNMISPGAPVGKDERENVVLRQWGQLPKFSFKPRDHVELAEKLDLIDFKNGAKVGGSNFYYLKNETVLLELALVRYALDFLIKDGFTPFITPDLAKSRYYLGTGYLPRGPEAQTFMIEGEDLGLIATAEVPLAGLKADEILKETDLPQKYVGYSHCFRKEAGGYGKYSRGLYRVHQFTKVEMFVYSLPENSEEMHEYLLTLEEKIFQGLEIPYRVVEMCTGDLGAQAARKFDLEAWMPGRLSALSRSGTGPAGGWGEITSTSNCLDYQARRLNIRYRKKDGTVAYPHMLNGTAIATSRTIIAILENYQQKDGSIVIPSVLQKYMGQEKISR